MVPRLWDQTIDAHRHAVREAIMDNTWTLVTERGPAAVTMSLIAERTGIGRATLYKYFGDVTAILHAWHEREIEAHLRQLTEIRDRTADVIERLTAVLALYARIMHRRGGHDGELTALLHPAHHGDGAGAHARQRLHGLVEELLADAATTGAVRRDVPIGELSRYCLHALDAAAGLPDEAAVERLVAVTLDGLEPR